MKYTPIERAVVALGDWLYGLGCNLNSWAYRRSSAREQDVRAARFGPWKDVGEPVTPSNGFVFSGQTVEVGPGDEISLYMTETGQIQTRVRSPLH